LVRDSTDRVDHQHQLAQTRDLPLGLIFRDSSRRLDFVCAVGGSHAYRGNLSGMDPSAASAP
jgi:hypothetical protein